MASAVRLRIANRKRNASECCCFVLLRAYLLAKRVDGWCVVRGHGGRYIACSWSPFATLAGIRERCRDFDDIDDGR